MSGTHRVIERRDGIRAMKIMLVGVILMFLNAGVSEFYSLPKYTINEPVLWSQVLAITSFSCVMLGAGYALGKMKEVPL
jgi:hypothetical protein